MCLKHGLKYWGTLIKSIGLGCDINGFKRIWGDKNLTLDIKQVAGGNPERAMDEKRKRLLGEASHPNTRGLAGQKLAQLWHLYCQDFSQEFASSGESPPNTNSCLGLETERGESLGAMVLSWIIIFCWQFFFTEILWLKHFLHRYWLNLFSDCRSGS